MVFRFTLRRNDTAEHSELTKRARADENGICFAGENVIDKLMGDDLSFHRLE